MKALVIYDSVYGNTEKIAKAMGNAIGEEAEVLRAGDADPKGLAEVDLLIVGTPVHGGRPTAPVKDFLGGIPKGALSGKAVAGFDTRSDSRFARIFGWAAPGVSGGTDEEGR